METGKFTITVWDNCDFLEETESGRGTTHIVNGFKFNPRKIQQHPRMMNVGHQFQNGSVY